MGASSQGANLDTAYLKKANLFEAQLLGANLIRANLQEANLNQAQLQGAILDMAQLQGVNLFGAQLEGANLSRAQLQGANLSMAQLQRTMWQHTILTGTAETANALYSTNFSANSNNGGALRFVDLSQIVFDTRTDWRNVFLDGSVTYPRAFERMAGRTSVRPCQWVSDPIPDNEEFHALWRWWTSLVRGSDNWWSLAPEGFEDVEPASPELRAKYGIPEDCAPQTGPLKTFPGPHGP